MDYLSKGTGVTLGTLGTVGFGLTAHSLCHFINSWAAPTTTTTGA